MSTFYMSLVNYGNHFLVLAHSLFSFRTKLNEYAIFNSTSICPTLMQDRIHR